MGHARTMSLPNSRTARQRGFVAAVYDCRIGVTPNLRSPFRPFQKNSSNSVHSVQSPPPPGSHRQPLQAPRGSAYVDLSRRSRAARRRIPKKICSIPVDFFFGLVSYVYKNNIPRLKLPTHSPNMIPRPSIIQKPFSPLADSFCARGRGFLASRFFHPGSLNPIHSSCHEF